MMQLLFEPFHAATIAMGPDGGLLISSSRERLLAWGIVFCISAAAALALTLSRRTRRPGLVMLAATLLVPLAVMPGVRQERIHVLPSRISIDEGGWWDSSPEIIDLRELKRIRQHEIQIRVGGLLIEPNAIWSVSRHDGSTEKILLNEFFTAHRMVIAQYLRDRGHRVERAGSELGAWHAQRGG